MDATRRVDLRNERGVALVYLIIALVVLLGMAAVAIDMGYMYVNKANLQTAADSGALAGAGRLNKQPLANLTGARNGAKKFADTNFGLTLDTNITNDSGGDIVIGNWNSSTTPPFTPSGTPLNAVKVVARRTGDTGTGIGPNSKFDLFFSRVIGTNTMGAAASAIASRPSRARTYFMVGHSTCNVTSFPYLLTPQVGNLAWTDLSLKNTDSNDVVNNFFCPAEPPFIDVCGLPGVATTNGTSNTIFQSVETDFYDLTYDSANKTTSLDNNNNPYVYSWNVIVPVSADDDPSANPNPHPVWGYAQMTIIKACGNGSGTPCPGRNITAPNSSAVPADRDCGNNNGIFISSITCSDCANSDFLGALPVIAQ